MEPLDNPVWHALCGPQATLAEGSGGARRFPPEYAPFAALADDTAAAWDALADIVGPGGLALLVPEFTPRSGWRMLRSFRVHQMVLAGEAPEVADTDHTRIEVLDASDAAAMATLVSATEPGPWSSRTHELGEFVGIRVDGRLVAMAGQRMRVPGSVELSGVCTDPDFRGRGFARAVVAAITVRTLRAGARPFLHVRDDNLAAVGVYEQLGFRTRAMLEPGVYQARAENTGGGHGPAL